MNRALLAHTVARAELMKGQLALFEKQLNEITGVLTDEVNCDRVHELGKDDRKQVQMDLYTEYQLDGAKE